MYSLFYFPGACSLAPHIALETVGAEFEAIKVDFRTNEQRTPAYLAKNPKGRVPALVTPQGVLTENPAILLYIAQAFPASNLLPDGMFEQARLNEFNAYLSCTVHVAHAHGPRGSRWADDESALTSMKAKVQQNMTDCFELIENEYFKGPWVMGEQYTIGDMYLYTISTWLEADGVDVNQFKKISVFRDRLGDSDIVRRVVARESGR